MAFLVIKKVVREHVDVRKDNEGKTFGQILDESIAANIAHGAEISAIEFGFEGDEWFSFMSSPESEVYRSEADHLARSYEAMGVEPKRRKI